jgi:hypothetical protein
VRLHSIVFKRAISGVEDSAAVAEDFAAAVDSVEAAAEVVAPTSG